MCEAVVAGLSAGRKPAGSVKRSVRRVRSPSSPEGGEDMAIGVVVCFFLSFFSLFFLVGRWMDSGVVGSPRVSRVRLRSRIKRFGSCRGGASYEDWGIGPHFTYIVYIIILLLLYGLLDTHN